MLTGQLCAFYLFDIAESIDLPRLTTLLGGAPEPARFVARPSAPSYVQYHQPPLQIDAEAIGLPALDGWHARLKTFDYGVVSVSWTRKFSGTWDELVALGVEVPSDASLERTAEQQCRALVDRIKPALTQLRDRFLSEDYFVFSLDADANPMSAETLMGADGERIAQLLRGEHAALSAQEREEVLRHRLSYLANDLVIPTWSTAFVFDTTAGVHAAWEIFEYANSQLLQFRSYDELLDGELARIYKELESSRGYQSWFPRRYTRAARHVHALFVDVNELTDRTENALKLVGDVYAARLLALAHARLGVTAWRDSVHDKLKTLDEIYRFAVDQTGMERGELLELAIVLILIFELVLFFLGIMR